MTTGVPETKSAGTVYVALITLLEFGGIIPKSHGKAVVQSPVLLAKTKSTGAVSARLTFAALLGPALDTMMVYVTLEPGVMVAGPVLTTLKSACGVKVLLSALLFEVGSEVPAGGVTVAELTKLPVALARIVPVAKNVSVPPLSTSTFVLILPVPDAGQLEPLLAVHVQVIPVIFAGKLSTTFAPTAALGPALVTVIL